MNLGWFVVFWEDEGVEEAVSGRREESGTRCALKTRRNSFLGEVCGKGEVVCQTGTVCYVRGMRPEGQQIWDENKALHA